MNTNDGSAPPRERAILVGLETGHARRWHVEDHLSELAQLAATAGADVAEVMAQKLPAPNAAFYIGKGKAEELRSACQRESAGLVIFDDDLSPAQVKNLQELTGRRVIDRTELIMDIFARHAKSREGKIQVELAQLRYMLPRLTRAWTHLSRQEGGIGTRGPGEQQLEIDRRRIREKIDRLTDKLSAIGRERETQSKQRRRGEIPVAVIVGYTNAGKSTLMNALTDAGVLVEDKLFATLDPTTRAMDLPRGRRVLLTDTVGFIRKLPHHLIESFKATMEGVATADLLVHVIDAAHPQVEEQVAAASGVLREIGAAEKPVVAAFNKIDLLRDAARLRRLGREYPRHVMISARTGEGLAELLQVIEVELAARMVRCTLIVPQAEGALLSKLRGACSIFSSRYEGENVIIEAELTPPAAEAMKKYMVTPP